MTYGDHMWDENGIPPGPLAVIVDLSAQTVSVFRGGHEVGTAVALYGANEKPTPTGRFKIIDKRKDHWSATYDAPMPYMLRLTQDGVAIHGSSVLPGAATHGCIGVPLEFARQLFHRMRLGDEVVILRNARAALASESATT
jgi:lipoprotein-anchoring transpeptidase ErfK/SrfK